MKEREKKKTRNWYFLLWWPCNFYADAESSESVEYSSYVLSKTFLLHCSAITDCMKNRLKTTLETGVHCWRSWLLHCKKKKKMKKGKTLSMLTVLSKLKTSFWSDVSSVIDQGLISRFVFTTESLDQATLLETQWARLTLCSSFSYLTAKKVKLIRWNAQIQSVLL